MRHRSRDYYRNDSEILLRHFKKTFGIFSFLCFVSKVEDHYGINFKSLIPFFRFSFNGCELSMLFALICRIRAAVSYLFLFSGCKSNVNLYLHENVPHMIWNRL